MPNGDLMSIKMGPQQAVRRRRCIYSVRARTTRSLRFMLRRAWNSLPKSSGILQQRLTAI